MLQSIRWRAEGAPIMLRVSALAVLVVGAAGVVFKEMPPYEAGRLYLIALGLYLLSPAEMMKKGERTVHMIRSNKRFLFGAACIVVANVLIAFQFLAGSA